MLPEESEHCNMFFPPNMYFSISCRLFQYGSKFCWYYLEQQKRDPLNIEKLKKLEASLSATRKGELSINTLTRGSDITLY